ncbi:MAG TPA: glycosyltransferase family 4 protein [Candidatus Hydrogenedentes bacterium]|nr:glycosyltransferase family 4 protein [Candidatus Hydrogenedentota bacterium]HOK88635.1 glycosyltransferase family 4 protein [Candidatus Hydrogenedentota bacterium]
MADETLPRPLAGLRVAIVDLLFSWPPNGGADVDLFHVMDGLVRAGVDARLFTLRVAGSWERGRIPRPETLPCPARCFEYSIDTLSVDDFSQALERHLQEWTPHLVFMAHGFTLKPLLLDRLARHWPVLIRYYAHEMACLRDARRFKDGLPCPRNCLLDIEPCRQCAIETLTPAIRSGRWNAWIEEFIVSGAWRDAWTSTARQGIGRAAGVIVSNSALAQEARAFNPNVYIIPGGARVHQIPWEPEQDRTSPASPVVFMPGRCDDPAKGLDIFRQAAELLTEKKLPADFRCTHPDPFWEGPPVRSMGWLTPEETLRACATSSVIVVPSVWHEPFGLVAVEAMATGRPVVASRTGGLADIIVDGETGILVSPGDPEALADAIAKLLSEPETRARMGAAGRLRAEQHYDWDVIINRHYVPILAACLPR